MSIRVCEFSFQIHGNNLLEHRPSKDIRLRLENKSGKGDAAFNLATSFVYVLLLICSVISGRET